LITESRRKIYTLGDRIDTMGLLTHDSA